MSNRATLKPFEKGTERARAMGRKAGLASARARAMAKACGMTPSEWCKARTFAAAAKSIAGMRAGGKSGKAGMTFAEATMLQMWKQAARGSVRSAYLLACLLGELPASKRIDIHAVPIIRDDVPRAPDK